MFLSIHSPNINLDKYYLKFNTFAIKSIILKMQQYIHAIITKIKIKYQQNPYKKISGAADLQQVFVLNNILIYLNEKNNKDIVRYLVSI